jgi:hypothetical protein
MKKFSMFLIVMFTMSLSQVVKATDAELLQSVMSSKLDIPAIVKVLNDNKVDPYQIDAAIQRAVENGDTEMVKALIDVRDSYKYFLCYSSGSNHNRKTTISADGTKSQESETSTQEHLVIIQ